MFDEAISLISMCSSMNSWLTPTVLFLLLNLMIGTIAFTSTFTSHKPTHHHPHKQPTFHQHHHLHHQQPPQHLQQQQQQQQQPQHLHQQHHQQQLLQPLLSRSSSVLQRIKSINFSNLYNFSSHPPATHIQHPQPEPEPEPEDSNPQTAAEEDDTPSMEEIYSRIKQTSQVSHYGRQNSDTKPSGGEVPVKLPKKMKKSASHKSAFNHFQIQKETGNTNKINDNHNAGVNRESVETVEEEDRESVLAVKEEREDEGVDAKADDFINRFKKQLQLQRIESIVRYRDWISRTSAQ